MNLSLTPRSHKFDRVAEAMGTRLLVLDVRIDAGADEVEKLRRFKMLKHDFYSAPETHSGLGSMGLALLAGAGAWMAWQMADSMTPSLVMASMSCAGLWSAKRNTGRTGIVRLQVKDVINKPVPFTRDSPVAIHEIAEQVTEQYHRLFGAMYEIEAFGMTREVTWNKEVYA